jgi:hypothetical protein
MDKLYKLARAAGGSFSCFGASFGLRGNDSSFLSVISDWLPPGTQRTSDLLVDTIYSFLSPPASTNTRVRRFYMLYENAILVKKGLAFTDLFDSFENAINLHVSQHAQRYAFVHAGVIAWRGRAIVMPGASCSGKSTLVKAFLDAGADYLSDEFAVFDDLGRIHAFPRPISLRMSAGTKKKLTAEELGASTIHNSIPLGMVVATRYSRSTRWRPREMSRGQAILSLLANSMSGQRAPKSNFEILRTATHDCVALRGRRGSAGEVVKACIRELDRHFPNHRDNFPQGEPDGE